MHHIRRHTEFKDYIRVYISSIGDLICVSYDNYDVFLIIMYDMNRM